MKFNKIFEVGILKTLIFNIHYFGLKGLKFPVVVSRKVKFENLKGRVECKYYKTASIHLGFSGVSIFDYNNERSIWDNEGGKILFEGQATLGQGTRISNHGKIYFGTNFRITANSSIICYEKIHFGKIA